MKSERMKAIRSWWIDRIWLDEVLAVVVVATHIALVLAWPIFDVLGNAAPADRRAVYASTAVVVSFLGSFSAVAIGQVSSAKGDRAEAFRTQAAPDLARNWRSIFRVGMTSALLALGALLLDPSKWTPSSSAVVVRWVFEFGVILAIIKFVRLSSLFLEVITIAGKSEEDGESRPKVPAPAINPDLLSRAHGHPEPRN